MFRRTRLHCSCLRLGMVLITTRWFVITEVNKVPGGFIYKLWVNIIKIQNYQENNKQLTTKETKHNIVWSLNITTTELLEPGDSKQHVSALCMLTGTMSIYFKTELRAENYEIRRVEKQERYNTGSRSGAASIFIERIKKVEERMEKKWREKWSYYREDNWPRRLINYACIFKKYRRNIEDFTMQILSGHGIFNVYRKTINKEVHSRCWDCNAEENDAEHALYHCPTWINDWTVLENYLGMQLC